MIRAVIFDWGHVLIDNSEAHRLLFFSKKFGVDVEKFKSALDKYMPFFTLGEIDEADMWLRIQTDLNLKKIKIENFWDQAWESGYKPFPEMWEVAKKLEKNNYKIAILSNCELPTVKLSERPEYSIFNAKIFSCLVGIKKPDAKIYQLALEKLGVKPEEAIFIDDKKEYTEAAKMVGLRAIHHDPNKISQTIEQLKTHGIKI